MPYNDPLQKGLVMPANNESMRRTLVKAAVYVMVVVAVGTLATNATEKACDKLGI
jgi:hypothetical protein